MNDGSPDVPTTPDIPAARVFKYVKPKVERARHVVKLARTERIYAQLQVIAKGGENVLHSHAHLDGLWMVIKGRARFYGEGDVVIADLGPFEGVVIPRNLPYWFEASGEDELEILQVEASDISMGGEKERFNDITHYKPAKWSPDTVGVSDGRS